MPDSQSTKRALGTVARYVAAYLAWAISSLAALYALLKTWEATRWIYVALRLGPYGYMAVSVFSVVILGVIGLVGTLYVQGYYRQGAEKGLLPRRFLRVTLIEAAIIVVALAILLLVG